MERQPNPDDPAYRDKSTKKKLDSKTTKSPGQILDKKNPNYTEGGIIDTGELDKSGKPLMISSEMEKSYEKNKGNPEFNREMDAYRKAKNKGNLTDEDRIRILNRNKQLLQIGQSVVQTGRNALAIGNGLYQFSRALSGFK